MCACVRVCVVCVVCVCWSVIRGQGYDFQIVDYGSSQALHHQRCSSACVVHSIDSSHGPGSTPSGAHGGSQLCRRLGSRYLEGNDHDGFRCQTGKMVFGRCKDSQMCVRVGQWVRTVQVFATGVQSDTCRGFHHCSVFFVSVFCVCPYHVDVCRIF